MDVIERTLTVREAYDIAVRDMKDRYVAADSIAEAERGASSLVPADQLRGAVAALRAIVDAGDQTDEWEAIDRAREFLADPSTTRGQ